MNSLTAEDKQNLIRRLKRIEGQVRGIQRMIEEDKYCVDILIQISAVRGALKKAAFKILDRHTRGCVQKALRREEGEGVIDELLNVLAKFTD